MTKKIQNILLTAISTVISVAFIFSGIGMTQNDSPSWIKACGFLTIFYGVANATMFCGAWLRMNLNLTNISKFLAIGYMSLFFVASLDVGIISGLEWIGLILVAILLFLNCYIVRRIETERSIA